MSCVILPLMAEKTAADRVRERIREWLDVSGETQEEFVARFGRTKEWLQKVVSGENHVRLADIDRIAHAMHLSPSDLVRSAEEGRFQMDLTPTEMRLIHRVRHRPKALEALEEIMQLYPQGSVTKSSSVSKSGTRQRTNGRDNP